jgi:hypothetical protein
MNKYLEMLKSEKRAAVDPAKPAKHQSAGSAGFAGTQRDRFPEIRDAADDPASIPPDCVGALRDPEGGLYLPWGPYLLPGDVRRMRAELVELIEALAALERWPLSTFDDVISRAMRGPLVDLLPNLAHFRECLEVARAEAAALRALELHTTRPGEFEDRRLA